MIVLYGILGLMALSVVSLCILIWLDCRANVKRDVQSKTMEAQASKAAQVARVQAAQVEEKLRTYARASTPVSPRKKAGAYTRHAWDDENFMTSQQALVTAIDTPTPSRYSDDSWTSSRNDCTPSRDDSWTSCSSSSSDSSSSSSYD